MTEKINLKEIERKAYTSYHQDGLIDIFIGFTILAFGILMFTDLAWMGGIFAIVAITGYTSAKKVFTIPRIGYVKFVQYKVKMMFAGVMIAIILTALLGSFAFIAIEIEKGMPLWMSLLVENGLLIIGLSGASFISLFAYVFRIYRLYAYGILTLIIFVAGHFVILPFPHFVVLLGALILLSGLSVLIRFLRKYPIPVKGSIGDKYDGGQ